MTYYRGLEVRSYKEVREDHETRKARSHRVNIDLTEDEWFVCRRHAEIAQCSLVELLGAAVRAWMESCERGSE